LTIKKEKEAHLIKERLLLKHKQGYRNIQFPLHNTFKDIWKYKAKFDQIDFVAYIGPSCPVCGKHSCYRQIHEYYRYAIDLFPFQRQKVPIARFWCKTRRCSFSYLPHQLIPYCQYTIGAVAGALILAYQCYRQGHKGYYGASVQVDPNSLVTPFLIYRWAIMAQRGFNRAHHVLAKFYSLSSFGHGNEPMLKQVYLYIRYISGKAPPNTMNIIDAGKIFSRKTNRFLFGISSSERL
jgi:hypothetical protein